MTSLRQHTISTCYGGNLTKLTIRSSPSPLSETRSRPTRRFVTSSVNDARPQTGLPQQTDLLDVYRGLVATGRIRYDEDQIRVVMQLRRLSNALRDYAPPAFVSQYYRSRVSAAPAGADSDKSGPWYLSSSATSTSEEGKHYDEVRSLVRLRSQAEALADLQTPKGLLLTGPPGCGKSFLVDLWFSTLPTPFKIRKHYSELVLEIYRGVWEETRRRKALLYAHEHEHVHKHKEPSFRSTWTRAVRTQWRKLLETGTLPKSWRSVAYRDAMASTHPSHHHLPPISFAIAHRLVTQHWLLAFDELQLLDVSSAGLLADVLSWFWRMGGIVVASSNKVPDDLYRGGVQRERLEPFVEALKTRCPVHEIPGKGDWRREKALGHQSYWFTSDRDDEFWNYVNGLTYGKAPNKRDLSVFGRKITVARATGDTCMFSFSELCDESLGPADYISIASHFRTVIITSIPVLRVSAKNQSRRFISLIDALYEARCRVVALAEAELDELFFPDAVAGMNSVSGEICDESLSEDQLMAEAFSESREVFRPNVSSYEGRPERPAASPLSLDSLSIFSGEEERFAYKRALSRLIEMTSGRYAREDQWDPLASNRRKWEGKSTADPSPSNARSGHGVSTEPVAREETRLGVGSYVPAEGPLANDFAAEAVGEGEVHSQQAVEDRPSAPQLTESHFWGVREDWGEKAGRWGKGAAAFEVERSAEKVNQ